MNLMMCSGFKFLAINFSYVFFKDILKRYLDQKKFYLVVFFLLWQWQLFFLYCFSICSKKYSFYILSLFNKKSKIER